MGGVCVELYVLLVEIAVARVLRYHVEKVQVRLVLCMPFEWVLDLNFKLLSCLAPFDA